MRRCDDHPRYGAVRKPAVPCPMCWAIYLTMHGELFEKYGMRLAFVGLEDRP